MKWGAAAEAGACCTACSRPFSCLSQLFIFNRNVLRCPYGGTNDNLILEHLRAVRADLGELKGDMRDVKVRLGSIESYIAVMHGDQARTAVKVDDLEERIERLEKRAGLLGADA